MKRLLLVFVLLLSQTAFSKDSSSGCGPGWYVFNDNSIVSSALRATTNGILFPTVTIGMTLGTSGCSQHTWVKYEQQNLKFTTENYFEIASESTKGKGQFLATFGEMLGCRGEMNQLFQEKMKVQFKAIYPTLEVQPEEVLKQTYIMILNDPKLSTTCFAA